MDLNRIEKWFSQEAFNEAIHKNFPIDKFLTTMHAAIPEKDLENTNLFMQEWINNYRWVILENLSENILIKNSLKYSLPNWSIQNIRYPTFEHAKKLLLKLDKIIELFNSSWWWYMRKHKDEILVLCFNIISTSQAFIDANKRIARRSIKYLAHKFYNFDLDLKTIHYTSLIEHQRLFSLYALPNPENPTSRWKRKWEYTKFDVDTYSEARKIHFTERYFWSIDHTLNLIIDNIHKQNDLLSWITPELGNCIESLAMNYIKL